VPYNAVPYNSVLSQTLGNIALGLSLLLFLILQFLAFPGPTRGENGMGQAFGLALILLPLWICLGGALLASAGIAALDWLTSSRGLQITALVFSCIAMMVVSWFSSLMIHEPANQIPWAARPFLYWAIEAFPIVVMIFCAVTLNSRSGGWWLRVPLALVAASAMLSIVGMLGEWFISSQQREYARADAIVSEQDQRTKDQIQEVTIADPEKDFGNLLLFTNRYHDAKVREPAAAKLRTNPNLERELAEYLRNGRDEPLIFLDATDPPDRKPLAEPFRDGVLVMAKEVRERLRTEYTFHADSFDFDTRLILSVAEKLRGLGTDLVPAIREYRAAMEEPRADKSSKERLNCITVLDSWLKQNGR
jgi:hypothetical protein